MKKTLTLHLPAISVEVNGSEGQTQDELRKLGEEAVIKQLTKDFPRYQWSMTEGTVIKDEDVVCGRPVKMKSSGEVGIIYEVKPGTKYPVRILINGEKEIQCTHAAIDKVSKKASIDKLIKGRQEWEKSTGEWLDVRTGYFVNGKDIIPVVLNARGRGKMKAYKIDHESKGSYYHLTASNILRLFDTKLEAEDYASMLHNR
ncbi:hypothetical protein LIS77_26415 (plasmid) [Cytobacillus firmus]|uniref:hypothetical protein n=1 Tax=Cytobacillus firmus TaxID=1399 RepID=UPI00207924D4|nr:hypothetical protein [Cytobacillus firmus]USK41703.1 hypothetical protein LIS77_26415 [Cytobacillus firmus]